MSSTNRGKRGGDGFDQFPTPRWCVHRLLEAYPLPGGHWLEPCAGAGNIIKAVNEKRSDVKWWANEIDDRYLGSLLSALTVRASVRIGDAMTMSINQFSSHVIITNPPFDISLELLLLCLQSPGLTVFLQRANWFGGPRSALFRKIKPSFYGLPDRPSFRDSISKKTGKRSSQDSIEYGFWIFDGQGKFLVLNDTPEEVRRAEKKERREMEKLAQKELAERAA